MATNKKAFKHESAVGIVLTENVYLPDWSNFDIQGLKPGEEQFTDETYPAFGVTGDAFQRQTFKNVTVGIDKNIMANENPLTDNPYPDEFACAIRNKDYRNTNMLTHVGRSDTNVNVVVNYRDPETGFYNKHLAQLECANWKEGDTQEVNNVEKRTYTATAKRVIKDGVGACKVEGWGSSNSIVPASTPNTTVIVGPGAFWLSRVESYVWATNCTSKFKMSLTTSLVVSGFQATTATIGKQAVILYVSSGSQTNSFVSLIVPSATANLALDTDIQSWVDVQNNGASWIRIADITIAVSLTAATIVVTSTMIAKNNIATIALSKNANKLDIQEVVADPFFAWTYLYYACINGNQISKTGVSTETSSMVSWSAGKTDMIEVIYPTNSISYVN